MRLTQRHHCCNQLSSPVQGYFWPSSVSAANFWLKPCAICSQVP